jgi:hypothetical protein
MRHRTIVVLSTFSALSVIVWPFIWDAMIGFDTLAQYPLTGVAFLWPIIMGMLNLYLSGSRLPSNKTLKRNFFLGNARTEAVTFIGLLFIIEKVFSPHKEDDPTTDTATAAIGTYTTFNTAGRTVKRGEEWLPKEQKREQTLKRVPRHTKSLVSTAMMLCVAFLLPSFNVDSGTVASLYLENMQRSVLNYVIAFILAAGTINYSVSRPSETVKSLMKQCRY